MRARVAQQSTGEMVGFGTKQSWARFLRCMRDDAVPSPAAARARVPARGPPGATRAAPPPSPTASAHARGPTSALRQAMTTTVGYSSWGSVLDDIDPWFYYLVDEPDL